MTTLTLIERLFAVLAPHDCLVCSQEGSLLCEGCQASGLLPLPGRCYVCFAVSHNSRTCPRCCKSRSLNHVWVRSGYETVAKDLVHACKFSFAKAATAIMAGSMAEAMPYLPADTLIVHIPTASSRVRRRGFDHAALIARELSAQLSLRHVTALRRTGQQRQTGSKRRERTAQMNQAFTVLSKDVFTGKRIVLVDDVLTTGSTLEAAAKILKQAGAKSVDAVVFAQAV